MSRLAYILYVVSVLLISGLARAHADVMPLLVSSTRQVSAHIYRISVSNKGQFQLLVDSTLPNDCYGRPAIKLVRKNEQPNILILEVKAAVPADGISCKRSLAGYSMWVDVPTLVEAAQFPINEKEIYLIRTESYPFAITASGSDLIKK